MILNIKRQRVQNSKQHISD